MALSLGCRGESIVHDLIVLDDGSAVIAAENDAREVTLFRVGSDGSSSWTAATEATNPYMASVGDLVALDRDLWHGGVIEARSVETGEVVWVTDAFHGKRSGFRHTRPLASHSDQEIMVTRIDGEEIVFLDGNTGKVLGGARVPRSSHHVTRLGSRVFAGDVSVFERGTVTASMEAWGLGCVVGSDYVFAQRPKSGMRLVRFSAGDPARSTLTDLALPRDVGIAACLALNETIVLAGRDHENTHFWRIDRTGKVEAHRVVAGLLNIEEVQTTTERQGLRGSTRYVPVASPATAEHLLLDLATLTIVGRAKTDQLAELRRIGTAWYLIDLPRELGNPLVIGRIDGTRGVVTASTIVTGSVQPEKVRANGDSLWVFGGGWHRGLSVARLDAGTLVATTVGADLAVVPMEAFDGFPR